MLDDDTSKLGRKCVVAEHRSRFLSKWIERLPATTVFPPLGSAITVKGDNGDVRDRVADGFLGSLMCKGNDVQNYNNVALLSGPYVSAGALSIVPENFDKAMIVHAVRRNVKKSWMNDRDQFLRPRVQPPASFIRRCVAWSLFADSNQTASLRNVDYKGQRYQIVNHFFPFRISHVRKWKVADSEIERSLASDPSERFVAGWLKSHRLDAKSRNLLGVGEEVYRKFFESFRDLPTAKYKVDHWDAGWWQIKRSLVDAGLASDLLMDIDRILEQLGAEIRTGAVDLGIIATG